MNRNQKIIPIFFSSDDNYLPYLAVSIRSLIENASPEHHYRIHILNDGLDASRLSYILDMATPYAEIIPVDMAHIIAPIAERLNLRDYYTVAIYFRLFIASMFPQYHKVIYLDADITVNGDIAALYEIPLGQKILGAISDDIIASHRDFRNYAEQAVGVPWRRYFNSGVLLMNLDQFRMQNIERKFIYLLQKHHFDTICPDQDYLNVLCRDKVVYLDKTWNKMSIDQNFCGLPNLIHYNMFYKPWQYKKIYYSESFWQYAAMTPFLRELERTQENFGLRDKQAHSKANRVLHKNARRIAKMPNNFRCILVEPGIKLEDLPFEEVAHEA